MRIDELLRDDENERYIARHSVEPEEGEQVCFGRHYAWHQWGNRYIVLGQTEVGRYLMGVVDRVSGFGFRPVTARDMTEREKRLYRKKVRR
ncbi:MAG: hypothetical protein IMHGJWDQ_001687 [Candidatus Fervidibacter sp.]